MTVEDLKHYFDNVDEDKKAFALDTLDEYVFFLNEIKKLQRLPLLRVDRNNPQKQMVTPAGKQIKEYSQIVDAKRTTLLRILYKIENSAADELLAKLSEFE